MDALIRAGGLYNGHGHPVSDKPMAPFQEAVAARPACNTFFDRDRVSINGPFTADLILCLPMEDELDVEHDDIADIVMVLERGDIVVIQGMSPAAPGAVWQRHILPLLGGGHA